MKYNDFLKNNKVSIKTISKLIKLRNQFVKSGKLTEEQWMDDELINCYAVTRKNDNLLIVLCLNTDGECDIYEFDNYISFHNLLKEFHIVD